MLTDFSFAVINNSSFLIGLLHSSAV